MFWLGKKKQTLFSAAPRVPPPYTMNDFQKRYDFESRCNESQRIRAKYPERVPIILSRSKAEKTLPMIDRQKFLVPDDLSFAQFMFVVRKRIKVRPETSIFLFVGDSVMVPSSKPIKAVDEEFKDKDGYLYITYHGESTFGRPT